jgi:uncharacterized protein (TIGR02594 family)
MEIIPKWLALARKEVGVKEWQGARTNPAISGYFEDAVGLQYADEVSWCAAFVGAMLSRAWIKPSGSLLARSYLKWGRRVSRPEIGAVVVFPRGEPWQGHVGFVDAVDGENIWVISGNQDNAVTRALYRQSSVLGYRMPKKGKTK